MKRFEKTNNGNSIDVSAFDSDKELYLECDKKFIYLSPNQVNELINHLVEQLQSIGEPVEALNVAI
jgi:hypothetical protein